MLGSSSSLCFYHRALASPDIGGPHVASAAWNPIAGYWAHLVDCTPGAWLSCSKRRRWSYLPLC
ncbi:hypothetical protein D7B24_004743 [Verticillium nonalfalfae]|uniref:Uncharacterized protein n=1 Tax=Verticillium nonalfalfae TaxID=1051616 RepID=A0A3M9XWJ3_9PEZI|nr:uncharacterized protein D7B24_004743 [Verticillium nonalfalfae]RNJ52006.1 hypothetical protein D7B24_004743 [Verticillium nonalfalfae]